MTPAVRRRPTGRRAGSTRRLGRPRSVGQALALGALAVVLSAVASSAPAFVAATAEGAWRQDRQRLSEVVLGATVATNTIVQSNGQGTVAERALRVPELDEAVRREGRDLGLQPPLALTTLFEPVGASGPGGQGSAQVVSRDGADRNVRVVRGAADDGGALVPASAAERLGVGPGDVLALTSEDGAARVVVAGVYEDVTAPLPSYWLGLGDLFLPQPDPSGQSVRPAPPALILPQRQAVEVAAQLRTALRLDWFFPLPEQQALAVATREASRSQQLQLRLTAPERPAAGLLDEITVGGSFRTALPTALRRVDDTEALLAPPVRAVGAGGAAAALALVGAWAGLRARRREAELRGLIARGVSPGRAAASALAEAALPLVVGSAAGLGVGVLAVRLLGPVAVVTVDTTVLLWAVGAGLAGAATVGGVTAAAAARLGRVGVGAAQQLLGRVPLVPVLTAVAVVAALPLLQPVQAGPQSRPLGLLTLVVPLLVVVAGSAAALDVLQRLAPRWRTRLDRLPVGPLLAVRRVLAAPGATRLVIVSGALALGLVVYAGALGASTERTVAVKAVVGTGSDVVVDLDNTRRAPDLPGTTVVRRDRQATVLPGETSADVLAIDPERFAQVAFWTDELAARPLPELLGALAEYAGTRVPVLVVGAFPEQALTATGGELTLSTSRYEVPVQVVGRADAWPGMTSTAPLIVAPQAGLAAALLEVQRDLTLVTTAHLWARGPAPQVLASLEAAGVRGSSEAQVHTAQEFRDRPALRAQRWTLGYLRAVAATAGLLALLALGLHAAAEQRRRAVATVLLTRMGLTRRSSRRSAALELAVLGGSAALLGTVFTLPAARLLLRRLDPVPGLLPGPLFDVPGRTLASMLAAVGVAATLGAAVVDRQARRAPGGEVLRGGE